MPTNAEIDWIHRFLNALGRLPEQPGIVDSMTWALKAYAADPKRAPELAARAYARGEPPQQTSKS